ncbi:hypothetical protein [Halosolutus amylolyticus]|nr:hypothetical protein [Halosolutus amylolyticus]
MSAPSSTAIGIVDRSVTDVRRHSDGSPIDATFPRLTSQRFRTGSAE